MTISVRYPGPKPWSGFAIALLFLALLLGPYVEHSRQHLLSENGPVEIAQLVLLALSVVLYAFRLFRATDAIAAVCITATFVLIGAMLRETPRCSSTFYEGGLCLNSFAKDAGMIMAIAGALLAAYWRRSSLRGAFRPEAVILFWPLPFSALLLFGAVAAEHFHSQGVEELLELGAYFYTTAHAVWLVQRT